MALHKTYLNKAFSAVDGEQIESRGQINVLSSVTNKQKAQLPVYTQFHFTGNSERQPDL